VRGYLHPCAMQRTLPPLPDSPSPNYHTPPPHSPSTLFSALPPCSHALLVLPTLFEKIPDGVPHRDAAYLVMLSQLREHAGRDKDGWGEEEVCEGEGEG
jgi:hypothetical protein